MTHMKVVIPLLALLLALAEPLMWAESPQNQGVLVPSYFYPGACWRQNLDFIPKAGHITILNPSSGPGEEIDANYASTSYAARGAGSTVLGYVHTHYGTRDPVEVVEEVRRYFEWYAVDGIFLDEVSVEPSFLGYYQELAGLIRSEDARHLVVLNPGLYPCESYMQIADIIVTVETTFERYQTKRTPPWVYKYPARRFCHIVYEAMDMTEMLTAIDLSRQRNAGFVFITDDGANNPFDRLPSFWNQLLCFIDLP